MAWVLDVGFELTSFFLMVFSEECACSISRLTLSGSVSESTRPTSQRRYLWADVRAYSAHKLMRPAAGA